MVGGHAFTRLSTALVDVGEGGRRVYKQLDRRPREPMDVCISKATKAELEAGKLPRAPTHMGNLQGHSLIKALG